MTHDDETKSAFSPKVQEEVDRAISRAWMLFELNELVVRGFMSPAAALSMCVDDEMIGTFEELLGPMYPDTEVRLSPAEAPSTPLCPRCERVCAPEHVGPVRALKRACKCWWCEHGWEEKA